MRDSLDRILKRMCKIIHRIDAPFIAGSVVCHVCHTVDDRISHIDVGRTHIDACAEHFLTIRVLSFPHLLKQL